MAIPRYRDPAPVRPADLETAFDPGTADAAAGLAQAFSDFGQQTNQLAQAFAAEEGASRGDVAGRTGAPEPKSGFAGLSAFGRAYNSAAEAAYISKIEREVFEKIDVIERDSEANPEKFETMAGGLVAGYDDVLPEYRTQVENILGRSIAQSRSKILDQKLTYDRQQHLADYAGGVEASIANTVKMALSLPSEDGDQALLASVADNDARLAALQADHVIDPVSAEKLSQQYRDGLSEALSNARASVIVDKLTAQARADVEIGDASFSHFMARNDIDPEIKALVEQAYGDMRASLLQERSRTNAEFSADFSARLARGEYGAKAEADARQLYRNGASSVDEFQGFMAHIAQNEKAGIEKGVDISRVVDAMSQQVRGLGLDPKNPEDQKAVNMYFDHVVEQSGYAPGSPQWQGAAERVANRTNVLPDAADSFYRRSMMSEDPARIAQGAAGAARIMRTNDVAWDYNRDPKITSFALNVNEMLEAGVPVNEAVVTQQKLTFQMDDKVRQQLQAQYREDKFKITKENPVDLQNSLDDSPELQDPDSGLLGFFKDAPKASADMQNEYEKLVRDYYVLNNGDTERARDTAKKHMLSVWGYTTMNGKPELVKYPPEKMFPNITSESIINDKVQTLTASGYTGDPTGVTIAPIPGTTDRSNGTMWALQHTSQYGGTEPVLDGRNLPIVMRLNTGGDAARDTARELKKQLLKEAAAKREQAMRDRVGQELIREGMGGAVR